MITLITGRICTNKDDGLALRSFENFCVQHSGWKIKPGPPLFCPTWLSAGLYYLLHLLLRSLVKNKTLKGAVLSLGHSRRTCLFSKSFPWFTYRNELRVLWAADIWPPDYQELEKTIRQGRINLLLLSAHQAAEHFHHLKLSSCRVEWVPESIDTTVFVHVPWNERKNDIRTSGPVWAKYHEAIAEGCFKNGISYSAGAGNRPRDLTDTRICICFPRADAEPQYAGNVSALTSYYLQAMAAKCLILGAPPLDLYYLISYDAVVAVNWLDPVGQIRDILENPGPWQELIERNYHTARTVFHHGRAVKQISKLINEELNAQL